jgi:hypothetical protein
MFNCRRRRRRRRAALHCAAQGSPEEVLLKKVLHKGDAGALNVYTLAPTSGDDASVLLGWATFPSSYAAAPFMVRGAASTAPLQCVHRHVYSVHTSGYTTTYMYTIHAVSYRWRRRQRLARVGHLPQQLRRRSVHGAWRRRLVLTPLQHAWSTYHMAIAFTTLNCAG